ncbi:MAG: hypothetical protein K6G12_05620 [Lachnospiraceae bacterium]|nr:hypothetical protein [Lachnospiraceae bacterium]
MGYKNKKCLKVQAMEKMKAKTHLGRSKHQDKLNAAEEYDALPFSAKQLIGKQDYINDSLRDYIYSNSTYENYEKHNNYFIQWIEENHPECKKLDQCYQYVNEWLKLRIDQGLSPDTLALERCAIAKLYGVPATAFIDIPSKSRSKITRSRNVAKRDYGFSEKNNQEIIHFCEGTGLRRTELEALTKDCLIQTDEGYSLSPKNTKGGRPRKSPIIGEHIDEIVSRIMNTPDGIPVWESIPSHMDVHSYRAKYATAIYNAHARDIESIRNEKWLNPKTKRLECAVYYCRSDMKGKAYDKAAMLIASQALGHNRISIVAAHYLR